MKPKSTTVPTAALAASIVVVASLIGGGLAVLTHINTAGQAFSSKAELAAPWPTLVVQILAVPAIVRWRDWRGVVAASLFALTGLLALASLSDDETLKRGLPLWASTTQVVLIGLSAVAVIPCVRHIRQLRRTRR